MMNATTNFAATIGLDWADQEHDLWIGPADGAKAEHRRLEQTPEALHEWVAKLREPFGNRPVAIGIETSRGPVISALLAYDFIVLFPVNPKAFKDYRAAFSVSGAKGDRTDDGHNRCATEPIRSGPTGSRPPQADARPAVGALLATVSLHTRKLRRRPATARAPPASEEFRPQHRGGRKSVRL